MGKKRTYTGCFRFPIFAALAAIWLSLEFSSGKPNLWVVICSLISFLSFAVSAEGTVTAFDECDVEKFIYYLFWYNFGVISLGVAIMTTIAFYYDCRVVSYWRAARPALTKSQIRWGEGVFYFLAGLFLFLRWIRDLLFIPFGNPAKYERYVRELTDEQAPVKDHRCLMRIVMWRRLRNEDAP